MEPSFFGDNTDTSYASGKSLALQILNLHKQGHFVDTCPPLNKALFSLGNFSVAYPEEIHYDADKLDLTTATPAVRPFNKFNTINPAVVGLTKEQGGL